MAIYQAFGATIASNVRLPDLPVIAPRVADYFFYQQPSSYPSSETYDWFHQWTLEDGTSWALLAKYPSGTLIRFPGYADFHVVNGGSEIRCIPNPGIPQETTIHLFLDQVFPCLLSGGNQLLLHAASVAVDSNAVVFIGDTGSGKSTLTSSFGRAGFKLLTDDGLLVVEEAGYFWGVPSYPSLRLWPESLPELFAQQPISTAVAHYSAKQRISAGQAAVSFASERIPLHSVYLLRPQPNKVAAPISITAVSPGQAFSKCFNSIFRLDVKNHSQLTDQFKMTARLIETTPVFAINFPHDFSLLSSVRACILDHLSQNKNGRLLHQ